MRTKMTPKPKLGCADSVTDVSARFRSRDDRVASDTRDGLLSASR